MMQCRWRTGWARCEMDSIWHMLWRHSGGTPSASAPAVAHREREALSSLCPTPRRARARARVSAALCLLAPTYSLLAIRLQQHLSRVSWQASSWLLVGLTTYWLAHSLTHLLSPSLLHCTHVHTSGQPHHTMHTAHTQNNSCLSVKEKKRWLKLSKDVITPARSAIIAPLAHCWLIVLLRNTRTEHSTAAPVYPYCPPPSPGSNQTL
jgi:hypothetical protein